MTTEDGIVKLIEKVVGDYFHEFQNQLDKLKLLTENLQDKMNGFQIQLSELRRLVA